MGALALAAAGAQAAVNLNINVQYQTAVRPSSGSIFVTYSGTVDVLLPTFDVTLWALEFPGNSSSVFLNSNIDPGFHAYMVATLPGVDYVGALFTVEVTSTTALGFYWLNNNSLGMSPLSEFVVTADNGVESASDNEFHGVTVVPEPATMAAMGLGLVALARRRRK
jgi:hypothetical protein